MTTSRAAALPISSMIPAAGGPSVRERLVTWKPKSETEQNYEPWRKLKVSNKNTEKRNHKPSKLSLKRETLRTLSGEKLDEVVGTLAGDDTILVISRDARHAKALARQLEEWSQFA